MFYRTVASLTSSRFFQLSKKIQTQKNRVVGFWDPFSRSPTRPKISRSPVLKRFRKIPSNVPLSKSAAFQFNGVCNGTPNTFCEARSARGDNLPLIYFRPIETQRRRMIYRHLSRARVLAKLRWIHQTLPKACAVVLVCGKI